MLHVAPLAYIPLCKPQVNNLSKPLCSVLDFNRWASCCPVLFGVSLVCSLQLKWMNFVTPCPPQWKIGDTVWQLCLQYRHIMINGSHSSTVVISHLNYICNPLMTFIVHYLFGRKCSGNETVVNTLVIVSQSVTVWLCFTSLILEGCSESPLSLYLNMYCVSSCFFRACVSKLLCINPKLNLFKSSMNSILLNSLSFTESLDELTSMVVKLFGAVENKSVPIPEFPEHPFQEEHLRVSRCVFALKLPHMFALVLKQPIASIYKG